MASHQYSEITLIEGFNICHIHGSSKCGQPNNDDITARRNVVGPVHMPQSTADVGHYEITQGAQTPL